MSPVTGHTRSAPIADMKPVCVWVHPAIAGILEALPHPTRPFPVKQREALLNALDSAFVLVYSACDRTDEQVTP